MKQVKKPIQMLLGALALSSVMAPVAQAGNSKLLATGGVTQFEGAAGGGLVPWALIGGYGTDTEIGATSFVTTVQTSAYDLNVLGATVGFYDRVEVSFAHQNLGVDSSVIRNTNEALTGLVRTLSGDPTVQNQLINPGTNIKQNVFGFKVRLFGDAVYSQADYIPQVALGVQYKRNQDFDSGVNVVALGNVGVPKLLGAKSASGTDIYLAATKVFLGVPFGKRLLVNATVRATKANAFGLLGFGREVINPLNGQFVDSDNSYKFLPEASVGLFMSENVVLGAEVRRQGNRLDNQPILGVLGAPRLAKEDTAWDAFVAYVPNKSVAFTAAYVDLGNLPFQETSSGFYLSAQASF
jgi:hypothetical protein